MCRYYLILLLACCIVIFCWSTPISAGFPFCRKPTMNDVFAAVRRLNEEVVAKINEDLECQKVLAEQRELSEQKALAEQKEHDEQQQFSGEASKSSKDEMEANDDEIKEEKIEEGQHQQRGSNQLPYGHSPQRQLHQRDGNKANKEEKESIQKKWNELFEAIWNKAKEQEELIWKRWEVGNIKEEKKSISEKWDEIFEAIWKKNMEEKESIREKWDKIFEGIWNKDMEEKEPIRKKWDEMFEEIWDKAMGEKEPILLKWDEIFERIGNMTEEEHESIRKKWNEIFEFWNKVKEQKKSIRKICLWNQEIQTKFSAILQAHQAHVDTATKRQISKQIKDLRISAIRHMDEAKAEARRNLSDEQVIEIKKKVYKIYTDLTHFQRKKLQNRVEELLDNHVIQYANSEQRLLKLYELTWMVKKLEKIDAQSEIVKLLHDITLVIIYIVGFFVWSIPKLFLMGIAKVLGCCFAGCYVICCLKD